MSRVRRVVVNTPALVVVRDPSEEDVEGRYVKIRPLTSRDHVGDSKGSVRAALDRGAIAAIYRPDAPDTGRAMPRDVRPEADPAETARAWIREHAANPGVAEDACGLLDEILARSGVPSRHA